MENKSKKIKEDFKGLKNAMGTEMGKTLSNIPVDSHGDFMTAASEMMRSVDEESDIIRKPYKKGVSKNLVTKKKMKLPIGKLLSIGKSGKNTNYEVSEEIFESLLMEFTEIMVMCTPWKKCMEDPMGKNPETKWFVGRLEYNEYAEDWYPYSQDSRYYKTKEDASNAYFEGLYNKEPLYEKWSQKYKKSIDCKNPKGFSQRAHCQGKKKRESNEEILKGGKADKKTLQDIAKKHDKKGYYHIDNMVDTLKQQLNKGIKVEMEHTKSREKAKEIAMDHLYEDPYYYNKLKKIEGKEAMGAGSAGAFVGPIGFDPNSDFVKRSFKETPKKVETKEATGSASSGSYVTPAAWAKSLSKKDWRGKSKTQIPGGSFVQVKKKCKKFPYCNQGDIKALNLTNESKLGMAIKSLSKKEGISEELIKQILLFEYYKTK
jgi:hypothetical protein